MIKKTNYWRGAFFSLLALVLMICVLFVVLYNHYFPTVDENHNYVEEQSSNNEAIFMIQTTKSRLNHFISAKIAEAPSDVSYTVELMEKNVQSRTSVTLFGQDVPITIDLFPIVAENGDLLLEVETFSVGILRLPVERVLVLVSEWIDFPNWITIYPMEHFVEVKVTDLNIGDDEALRLRFNLVDLVADEIELELVYEEPLIQ